MGEVGRADSKMTLAKLGGSGVFGMSPVVRRIQPRKLSPLLREFADSREVRHIWLSEPNDAMGAAGFEPATSRV
jgi:hypothetical protein